LNSILTPRAQFLDGMRAQLPTLAGVIPFGLAAGAYTANVLNSAPGAIALHAAMFAGRGQMIAVQMLDEGAPLLLLMLAALIVNLRNMVYAAGLAPHINHLSPRWRAFLAFFIVDNVFAFTIERLRRDSASAAAATRHFYLLGSGVFTFVVWTAAGIIGAVFGQRIPGSWGLELVPQLAFIYVLSGNLRTRTNVIAGVAAGLVATAFAWLPLQLGLFAGVLAGMAAGMLAGQREAGT
jgi:predicted branched-subunit amino acid permease